ncbi:MAG: superoxide dismutase [Bacteroides sp.]|nr:MAG: superoxide dismutase [Bacteroides sp.]
MSFILQALPYDSSALEPYIDKYTMELHYGKHHNNYVANLNKAIENDKNSQNCCIEDIICNISKYDTIIKNNAGGHYNHTFFWNSLTPYKNKQKLYGNLKDDINSIYGSFENFKNEFSKNALSVFGSGWTWLIIKDNKLKISSTINQDNPMMDLAKDRGIPILGIDLWEHAYYLKYQNRRIDYINAFFNIINWDNIVKRFNEYCLSKN